MLVGDGVVEEAVFLLLLGQSHKLRVEWVIGCEEGLLTVKNWRVGAGLVFEAVDLAGAERELDAAEQSGVGVGFEVGVGEVGDVSGMAVELDQIGARTPPAAGPAGLAGLTRRVSMKGFTFVMILFSRAFSREGATPNYCLELCMVSPEPTLL